MNRDFAFQIAVLLVVFIALVLLFAQVKLFSIARSLKRLVELEEQRRTQQQAESHVGPHFTIPR